MKKTEKYSTTIALTHQQANNPAECMGAISTFFRRWANDYRKSVEGVRVTDTRLLGIEVTKMHFGTTLVFSWAVMTETKDMKHENS